MTKTKKKGNEYPVWPKVVGIFICIIFIACGILLPRFYNEILGPKEYIHRNSEEYSNKVKESCDELKKEICAFNGIIGSDVSKNSNESKFLKAEEKLNKIFKIWSCLESYVNIKKKAAAANIFFLHSLSLLFILSGIIGLFGIAIWRARDERDKREKKGRGEV